MTGVAETNRLLRPSEVMLGGVMVATVLGFARLFDGDEFVLPLILTAVVAHAVPAAGRRRGWGLPRTALVSFAGFVGLTSWLFYLDTTLVGVPTLTTVAEARTDLADAWRVFQEVVAPAPVETGFLVASCLAIWLAAYLADWAAFRLWSSFEAIVPSTTLFVFAAMVGSTRLRLFASVLYLAAALGFILVHRVARQENDSGWLGAEASRGSSMMLRSGAALCVSAVIVAVVVGPQLPGIDEDAMWNFRDRGADRGSRVTLSPIVDIKKRLVEQSADEVFTVRSPVRSYWRLTSLDTFDGSIWKSKGDFEDATGELPATVESSASRVEATQEVTMKALAALWLPAAYEPTAVDGADADVVYEAESSTLIVGSDLSTSDGLTYQVDSAIPRFDRDALLSAPSTVPEPIAARYLTLPDTFSDLASNTADEVTAGLDQPYGKAIALQDFFQDNFRYSLDVDQGHSVDAVDDFLTTRAGYCEQFAGTYAGMARSVGLPARVAVGFTPGEVDPEDPDLYHVRGEHAHTWPEVYIEGFGWVPFEPTVSRGIPDAEPYTGVAEPTPAEGGATPSDPATSTTLADQSTPSSQPEFDPEDFAGGTATVGNDAGGPPSPWPGRLAATGGVLVVIAALYAAAVLAAARIRHRARRRRARGARARTQVAWAEALEGLAVAGVTPRPDETQVEFMSRVPPEWGLDPSLPTALGEAAAAAGYAEQGPSEHQTSRAVEAAAAIDSLIPTVTTRPRRWAVALDPRPLIPRGRPRLVTDRTRVRAQSA